LFDTFGFRRKDVALKYFGVNEKGSLFKHSIDTVTRGSLPMKTNLKLKIVKVFFLIRLRHEKINEFVLRCEPLQSIKLGLGTFLFRVW